MIYDHKQRAGRPGTTHTGSAAGANPAWLCASGQMGCTGGVWPPCEDGATQRSSGQCSKDQRRRLHEGRHDCSGGGQEQRGGVWTESGRPKNAWITLFNRFLPFSRNYFAAPISRRSCLSSVVRTVGGREACAWGDY